MKHIKITSVLFLLLSTFIFVKCKKDNITTTIKNTPAKEVNKVNYLFNPLSRDTKLFENYYLEKGNYGIGYNCQKGYTILDNRTSETNTAYGYVRINDIFSKVSTCSIDGVLLKEKIVDGNYSYSLERPEINTVIHNWFGKKVAFKMTYDGSANRTTSLDVIDSCYIPQEINVDGNAIKSTFGATSLNDGENGVSRNGNYTINWNADAKNTNGVAILVSWHGASFVETAPHNPSSTLNYIVNLDIVDDNGTYTIKAENFKDFPKNAIFSISLIRIGGTTAIVGAGQKLFVGASFYSFPRFYVKD